MTVGSYLNDLYFNGQALSGTGSFDIAGGRISDLSGAANLFARALREGFRPGGALSPVTTDIFFGGLASGLVDRQRGFERDITSNLVNQGVSPFRSSQIVQEARSGTQGPLRDILTQRAGLQHERAGREFEAKTDFASALGTLAVQSKQLRLQEMALREQKKARRISTALGIVSAIASLAGGAGTLFAGIGALGNKQNKDGTGGGGTVPGPYGTTGPPPQGGGGTLAPGVNAPLDPLGPYGTPVGVSQVAGVPGVPVNNSLFRQSGGRANLFGAFSPYSGSEIAPFSYSLAPIGSRTVAPFQYQKSLGKTYGNPFFGDPSFYGYGY